MIHQKIVTAFQDFFQARDHTLVPSSSLIPAQNDPSLLFVNAGMVQFKEIFSGQVPAPYPCAVSVQRCLRVGGKHNDLDNVGYTARHHTFFEMLGNFSFGAYGKREAIRYAWEFLTQTLKLSPDRLWVTAFEEDDETAAIWLEEIQIHPSLFTRCKARDNFWSMGDSGPCGPCTEIFYDYGPGVSGGPPGTSEADGDRYVEIWNLVFMQYERIGGKLTSLPRLCVDTGMGLERITAVMQGVVNNYDTELFQPLIQAVATLIEETGLPRAPISALRVIADHLRASAILIAEGLTPSNEGRAYVLRRLIRRAARHGFQIGFREPFLAQLTSSLPQIDSYPLLSQAGPHITQVLMQEEQQFLQTLHHGMKYFEQATAQLTSPILPGETVFKLYDTYGFPVDLTADLARERHLRIDHSGFEACMAIQKKRSQAASSFKPPLISTNPQPSTDFLGYEHLSHSASVLSLLDKAGLPVIQLQAGEKGTVLLDRTPFYAESGGQIGDQGQLIALGDVSRRDGFHGDGSYGEVPPKEVPSQEGPPQEGPLRESAHFTVTDTQKQNGAWLHAGYLTQGTLYTGTPVMAMVDQTRRLATARNHSATHLLHAALKSVLGSDLTQKGSLVAPTHLRFDFTCPNSITVDQIEIIERAVNQQILNNLPVQTQIMPLVEARKVGALALFGEKYESLVRVLQMGDDSLELCGGTHVHHTGDIGLFKITACTGIAAGIKRITAITGIDALEWLRSLEHQLTEIATLLKTDPQQITVKLHKQHDKLQQQAGLIANLKQYLRHTLIESLLLKKVQIQSISVLATEVPFIVADDMRELIDLLQSKLTVTSLVVLACQDPKGEAQISIGASVACCKSLPANVLAQALALLIGGKGGGRATFAQLRSLAPDLALAFQYVPQWVEQRL